MIKGRMLYYVIISIVLLVISGCVSVPPQVTPTPTAMPVEATPVETPAYESGVAVLNAPASSEAFRSFEISWRVNSPVETNIAHTSIHYGFESKSEPLTLNSYPDLTKSQAGSIPSDFRANMIINRTGTIYFRGHAIIDGINYWSEEISVIISPPALLSVKKTPHYESNTPAHGSILAGVPVNVVIDFNFDLGPGSSISIKTGDREYGTGGTIIDSNRLAMRRDMDTNSPDGLYTVNYKACWPDGSCHDGNFQFIIDRTKAEAYVDLRNKSEVTVKLSEISFKPQDIRIKKGTKVIWINEDNVEHYANTDAHPSHTYYLPQNSRMLKKGDTFSVTFDKAGVYPYHCSAHARKMMGTIIVE